MTRRYLLTVLIVFSCVLLLTACGQKDQAGTTGNGSTTTAVDPESLLKTRCTACHDLSRITSKKASSDQWKTTVERMVSNGAVLTAEEQQALIQYLADKYK